MNTLLGASGTGRTTFVNTLCESEVLGHKVADNAETAHVEEGIRIKPVNVGQFYLWFSFSIVPLSIHMPLQNLKRMVFVLHSPLSTRLVLVIT